MSDEPAQEFVDTNVLVYAHDVSAGAKHQQARELVQDLWQRRAGCLSVQVLQELYVTLTRKVAVPADEGTVLQIVRDLSFWRVHTPNAEDVLGAIALHRRYGISFWDAMILWGASQLGCGVLWSEDLSPDQSYAGLRVMNPFHA